MIFISFSTNNPPFVVKLINMVCSFNKYLVLIGAQCCARHPPPKKIKVSEKWVETIYLVLWGSKKQPGNPWIFSSRKGRIEYCANQSKIQINGKTRKQRSLPGEGELQRENSGESLEGQQTGVRGEWGGGGVGGLFVRHLLKNTNLVKLESQQWRFLKRSVGQWDK